MNTNRHLHSICSIITISLLFIPAFNFILFDVPAIEMICTTDDDGDVFSNESSTSNDTPLFTIISAPPDMPFFGYGLANVGDIQGDGSDDLIISTSMGISSVPDLTGSPPPSGWAKNDQFNLVLYGRTDFNFTYEALQRFEGMSSCWPYHVGNQFRAAGDLNGDGFDDVVSTPYWPSSSSLLEDDDYPKALDIWYGRGNGIPSKADRRIAIPTTVEQQLWEGFSYSGIGDYNGDGFDDLLVIVHKDEVAAPPPYETFLIARYEYRLHFGSPAGIKEIPDSTVLVTANPMHHRIIHDHLNGDAYEDWLSDNMTEIGNSTIFGGYSTEANYYVYLRYGMPDGFTTDADMRMPHDDITDDVGIVFFSTMDFNGDDHRDLAYFSQNSSGDYIVIFNGSGTGPALDSHFELEADWVPLIADVNGDGLDDLVRLSMTPRIPEGPVRYHLEFYMNQKGRYTSSPDWCYTIPWTIDYSLRYGGGDATTGDFNGDGHDDIAIGEIDSFTNYQAANQIPLTRPTGSGQVILVSGSEVTRSMEALRFTEPQRMFAGYRAYDFPVNANPTGLTEEPEWIRLILDPDRAGIQFAYVRNAMGNPFRMEAGDNGLASLVSTGDDAALDEVTSLTWLHFRIIPGWRWPHENLCDVSVIVGSGERVWRSYLHKDVFWVENDLDFAGEMIASGEWQGPLHDGSWARVGERLSIGGPTVVYEGTMDVHPPSGICNITLWDNDGDSITAPLVSGRAVDLEILADASTDIDEAFTLSIDDPPGTAEVRSSPSIHIGIDGDLPTFRDAMPDSDNWQGTNDVMVAITTDDGQTSGVDASTLEFQYSSDGPGAYGGWTRAGLATTPDGQVVEGLATVHLPDGVDNYVRWRVMDLVGNGHAISPDINVRVDTRNVTFTDPFPSGWQRALRLECGITITDVEGSGIDVGTVQYRSSPSNISHYGAWRDWDEGSVVDSVVVSCSASVDLAESEYNYIQWRAMDIAGNGYTTSPHHQVKVDVTPPFLVSVTPSSDAKQPSTTVSVVVIIDDVLSGVDASHALYRFSNKGVATQGEWRELILTRDDGVFTAHLDLECSCGRENVIQLNITDVAGNAFVTSPHTIWVNGPPVARIGSPHDGESYSSHDAVLLSANGTIDPDDDELSYTWILDSKEVLVHGYEAWTQFTKGQHNVTLRVEDDCGAQDEATVDIAIVAPKTEKNPFPCYIAILITLLLGILLVLRYRSRRRPE